jgi:hypothetical protein
MASDAIGRGPVEKVVEETVGSASRKDGAQRDVESAPEMIDIDRIERVYE